MKQKLKYLTVFLCGAFFFSSISYAATELKARTTDYTIVYNGKQMKLNDPIMSIGGKSHVPLRGVLEELGYEVGFDNGIISLSDEQSEKNEGVPLYTFEKLPITKEYKGIVVTVNSININEDSTDFDVTIYNGADRDFKVFFGENFVYNHSLPNKEMKLVGTIDEGVFKKSVPVGETVNGIVRKGKIPADANNLVFRGAIGASVPFEFPIKL